MILSNQIAFNGNTVYGGAEMNFEILNISKHQMNIWSPIIRI